MRKTTVPKSIRLPAHLVEYVDAQPGRDFTTKLTVILEEYRAGEKTRQKEIAFYDELIAKRKKEIDTYNDLAMTFANFRRNAIYLESQFDRILRAVRGAEDVI